MTISGLGISCKNWSILIFCAIAGRRRSVVGAVAVNPGFARQAADRSLRPSVGGGGIEPAGLPGSAGVGKGRARHRKIVSNPGISRAQIQMALTQQAEVPQIVGAEAAQITQVGNPFVFRTAFGQQFSMPKIANYLHDGLKAKTVAVIWVNNDFGKGGHDSFVKEMEPRGIKVIADLSTEQGQVDFASDVARLKSDQNGDID